ncbi:Uncharacterised protein [Zhongshania aliphaticivorans]|uniref:EF-hand domain-containing protein n=1 Tax=Zhongshania aliphaticivorans TaxID=1470434 RepID=A0A5S9NUC8_9GAMM|nr:EF-hand domain-containing protein [Zhongshania aliphaticivorans]CAA0094281.1 Uncharacterised protein [Zhongshania aliphaticivorans]CAA0112368.1 Uncharacterised protein [Zhongshania aliphaticivorans]
MNTAQKILGVLVSLAAMSAIAGEGEKKRPNFDLNNDGSVTTEELAQHRQTMFTKMDLNSDGNLTREELVEFKAQMKAEKEAKKEAKKADREKDHFDREDTNGDGVISQEEFAASAAKMAERVDRNDDGTIDRREMFKAMRDLGGERRKGGDGA